MDTSVGRAPSEVRPGLVISATAKDRPGIVNEIAAFIRERGGNIEDTRMVKLGGEFAVLLLVTGSEAALHAIERERSALDGPLGLSCTIRRTAQSRTSGTGLPYQLQVSALDRPGIVERVTQVLLGFGVNVVSLSSRLAHAPLSGTPLFELEAELEVPETVQLPEFRKQVALAMERENLDHHLKAGRS